MRHVARLVTIALMVTASAGARKPAKPATRSVTIEATSFQPNAITVKVGDVVVWKNNDPFPHTATSKTAGFDSHSIAPGETWKHTAAKRGEFTYVCSFHPTMTATLKVE